MALFRQLQTGGDIARVRHNQGYVARAQGDGAQAHELFLTSLTLFHERGNRRGVAECLTGLARLAGMPGQPIAPHLAAQLLGAADAQLAAIGAARWPADRPEVASTLATLRTFLDAQSLAAALAEGQALSLEGAVAVAISSS